MTTGAEGGLRLQNGSRIAVMGGGPAGSFFSYFVRVFAERVGLDVQVDIYEPRDFWTPGAGGCNMCGGIVSESLVQNLSVEGIELPDTIVQRGLDSYALHTDQGSIHIRTPLFEKRIATVHRGGGPKTIREQRWDSFDAHLMKLAVSRGSNFFLGRVTRLDWDDGRPRLQVGNIPPQTYDLLVGAIGVNSPSLKLFEDLGFRYRKPEVVKAYITEIPFGYDAVKRIFGSAMHVFLVDLPRLDFAALIPKGDFVTLCLLGEDIDKELIASFFDHPVVRQCFPDDWEPPLEACHCSPKMYFGQALQPFADRVVLIGDCGVSRLYKDGIGAAYRTAKAAARTVVFDGISTTDFEANYMRECRRIHRDNLIGKVIFQVVHLIKKFGLSTRAVLKTVQMESNLDGDSRLMSTVLWDTFTGSAPYRKIFLRTLRPTFLVRLTAAHLYSIYAWARGISVTNGADEGGTVGSEELGRLYRDGELIIRQGDTGDRMFVILGGGARVSREVDGKEVHLADLKEGDVFGEMALFDREVRAATVRALGDARILSVQKEGFLTRVHEDPSLAFRILKQMADRIRRLDEEVARLKLHGEARTGRA